MVSSTWKRYDITGLITLVVIAIAAAITLVMKPKPLYIPQNDSNSDFPTKDSTIPTWLLVVIIIIVAVIILPGLYFLAERFPEYFKKFNFFSAVWNFGIAVAVTLGCINIFKNMVGRSRPDIFDLCGKDFDPNDPSTCPELTESKFRDEFRSWPSGHSGFSMSGFGFLALFVQKTIVALSPVSTVVASLLYLLAIYIGSTRIVDFRHHPDDVIAGFFIGFIFSFLVWQRASEDIYNVSEETKTEASENSDPNPNGQDPL